MDLLKYLYYDEFNLDVLDKNRQTPLQFLCNYYRCNNKDYSIINYLLNCNVNIDHKDKNNDTALILAAEKNKPLIVQLLLDNGADITPINNAGLNCLYYIRHFDMYSISQEIYYKYYNILSNIRHNIFDTNLIIKIIINYI
jgi:ankyrin repeat protein